jgi:Natural resistance-associated macrophage protein
MRPPTETALLHAFAAPRLSDQARAADLRFSKAFFARVSCPSCDSPWLPDAILSRQSGVAAASDDDPSGIGTYSQAGAQLGFGVGWTMLITYPLMAAIQEISGRIGRVTGHGIAGNVCRNYPAPVIWSLIVLLFVANTINVAADLGAMGDALKLLIGGPGPLYVLIFGTVSVLAQIFFKYERYVAILKWLTLVLFAYVIALFMVKVPWGEALAGLFIPKIQWNAAFLTTLVAILGTTISPYLFIWQSSQEAEEQRIDPDKKPLKKEPGKEQEEVRRIRIDTLVGMGVSNLIAIAIIMTTAATLHASGKTNIESSSQAAEALNPVAGAFAELIFGYHRDRTACDTGAGGRDGLRHRRRPQMARRALAQTEGGLGLLQCVGRVCRAWRRTQLYPHRPYQSTLLERRDQRRAGGAGHDRHDAAGAARIGDG